MTALLEQKHGSENMLTLLSKEATLSALLDAVQTMPFIAEKRLVVVEGIPKLEKEECKELTASVHPQTVLLFADPKPDKRLSSVKELLATSDVKTFEPLSPAAFGNALGIGDTGVHLLKRAKE